MLLLFLQASNVFWLCPKFCGIFCCIFFSFLCTFLPSLKFEVLVKLLHWKRTCMCITDPFLRREARLWRICTVGGLCVYLSWYTLLLTWILWDILLTWMSNMGAWRMAGHCSSRTSLFEELWLWCNDWTLQYFDMKECGSAKHHQCRTSWRIHIQNHIIHKAESLLFWVVCWDFCPCARDQWITWKIGCIIASCGELHVCRR